MDNRLRSRLIRALAIAVGVLLLCNIGTIVGAFWLNSRLDRSYTRLLEPAIEQAQQLQGLALSSSQMHRLVLNLLLAEDSAERTEIEEELRVIRLENEGRVKILGASLTDASAPDSLKALDLAWTNYDRAVSELKQKVAKDDQAKALELRKTDVRPAFNRYKDAQREAGLALRVKSLEASNRLTEAVESDRTLLALFGGWPLAIVGMLCAAFLMFSIALVYLFKRAANAARLA